MEFYKRYQYCLCCYVIKLAGEIAKKVLLSIFWNLLLIEINLSQIRISDSKREKGCAVCPYLLFLFFLMWTTLNFRGRGKTKKKRRDIYKRTLDTEFERDRSIGLGSTIGDRQTDRQAHTHTRARIFSNTNS